MKNNKAIRASIAMKIATTEGNSLSHYTTNRFRIFLQMGVL